MKTWMTCIIVALLVTVGAMWKQVQFANNKWETAEANVKAYSLELSNSEKKNTAYKLTIEQLNYFQDSIMREMNKVRKELGVKDKKLQALQYIGSTFTKSDTLVLTDTVFKEPNFKLDTLIRDRWYSNHISLSYPSNIYIRPEFVSQKYVVVSSKRETINPPKKFFLFRWLQKKHTILNIDIVEKNPYVQDEQSKYIEIIK